MIEELVFTSSPRGLQPGRSGFCTVASTTGMSAPLHRMLESLSGYRHLFSPGTPDAKRNPVVYSHLSSRVGGRSYRIVSRISDAGLDYSNRTNKLAHHLAIQENQLPGCGPVTILKHSQMIRQWSGESRQLNHRGWELPKTEPKSCRSWQQVTGDAGRAGDLIEAIVESKNIYLQVNPETPVLEMLDEAFSLLPLDLQWATTFTTFLTQLPPNIGCKISCVISGSPESDAIRRNPHNLIIDLTKPLGESTSRFAAQAREGRPITLAPTRPRPALPAAEEDGWIEDELELEVIEEGDEDGGDHRLAPGSLRPLDDSPKPLPPNLNRLSRKAGVRSGTTAVANGAEGKRGNWKWILAGLAAILMLGIGSTAAVLWLRPEAPAIAQQDEASEEPALKAAEEKRENLNPVTVGSAETDKGGNEGSGGEGSGGEGLGGEGSGGKGSDSLKKKPNHFFSQEFFRIPIAQLTEIKLKKGEDNGLPIFDSFVANSKIEIEMPSEGGYEITQKKKDGEQNYDFKGARSVKKTGESIPFIDIQSSQEEEPEEPRNVERKSRKWIFFLSEDLLGTVQSQEIEDLKQSSLQVSGASDKVSISFKPVEQIEKSLEELIEKPDGFSNESLVPFYLVPCIGTESGQESLAYQVFTPDGVDLTTFYPIETAGKLPPIGIYIEKNRLRFDFHPFNDSFWDENQKYLEAIRTDYEVISLIVECDSSQIKTFFLLNNEKVDSIDSIQVNLIKTLETRRKDLQEKPDITDPSSGTQEGNSEKRDSRIETELKRAGNKTEILKDFPSTGQNQDNSEDIKQINELIEKIKSLFQVFKTAYSQTGIPLALVSAEETKIIYLKFGPDAKPAPDLSELRIPLKIEYDDVP